MTNPPVVTHSQRDQSIDIAKGLAIIAIVLGHVLRGLNSAGIVDDSAAFQLWDNGLYLWHLSVFAFLSGLFVQSSWKKRGTGQFLRERDGLFIWLYLVWSLLQGGVKLLAGDAVNSTVTAFDVVDLVHPEGQLWFFPWIAIATTAAALLQPWRSRLRATLVLGVAAALALLTWGWGGSSIGTQGTPLYLQFFLGVVIGHRQYSASFERLSGWWLVLAAAIYSVGLWVGGTPPTSSSWAEPIPWSVPVGVVACLSGTIAVLLLARVLASAGWAGRILGFLGERSLVIFTAHIIFASGTRIVLAKLGVDFAAVHVAIGLAAGITGPLLLDVVARAARFPWLFSAPRWLAGEGTAAEKRGGSHAAS